MGQPKYTIDKYVRLKDGSWRYCRAALYANHTIKTDVVIVGHREEKHSEGNYYLTCGGNWIPAGADAPAAQRQRHALLSGTTLEYELHSVRSLPKAAAIQNQEPVANGRKKVKDEIAKYLDDMIASKRPGKSVRMNPADARYGTYYLSASRLKFGEEESPALLLLWAKENTGWKVVAWAVEVP